jgi:hypothetical protein
MVILKSIFLIIGVIIIFSSMLVLLIISMVMLAILIISIFKAIKNGIHPNDL